MRQQQKKAALAVCLTFVFWITGCFKGTKPDSMVPMDSVTDPAFLADPTLWPKVEVYTGSPILEADPDREIYIGLANQDCDFYPGVPYTGVFFFVLTKEAYSSEEIKVSFPGKTRCEIRVRDYNDVFQDIARDRETGSYGPDGQQPYHFLCLKNVDMRSLAQKRSDASSASKAYNALVEKNQVTNEAYVSLIEAYVKPYGDLYQEYIEQYTGPPEGSITDYNAYLVNLTVEQKKYVDATVEHIDVAIGDSTYRVEFGQWRFHKSDWPEKDQNPKGISVAVGGVVGVSKDSPYAQGYLCTPDAFRFSTREDIFLTGIRCSDGTPAEILGAKIACTSADSSINYFWDGTGPVKVEKASSVIASIYLYSEKFKEYEMNATTTIYVDYVLASTGEEGSFAVSCNFPRANNVWDTYCLAFLGVDVGEYYHYFKDEIIQVSWIDEIPESWRRE